MYRNEIEIENKKITDMHATGAFLYGWIKGGSVNTYKHKYLYMAEYNGMI